MRRPRKWTDDAERMRAYRAAHPGLDKRIDKRKRPGHGRVDRDFIAIDGEAIGEQGYHLLAASTGDKTENLKGLSSEDCLRFLLELREKYGPAIYCGFALGYDCEHWIRDYGPTLWKQLRSEGGRGYVVLDGQLICIEYIPRKWFKMGISKKTPGRYKTGVRIFDLFSFWQAGFVSVIGRPEYAERMEEEFPRDPTRMPSWKKQLKAGWGACSEDELVTIYASKSTRGSFKAEDWKDIVAYNALECTILVRLANKLRDALHAADIRLNSWHGPGAVANFLLKRYNTSECIDKHPPLEVQDAIRRSFFGGRFQVFRLGHIEGVYDYDISSAYPYATSLLPSSTGEWESLSAFDPEALWALYEVSWAVDTSLTPFPWRSNTGYIHYPSAGRGWYWAWEVAAARRGWGDAIRVERGWRLHPQREGVFGWLKDLAAKRVAAKQAAKMATDANERDRLTAIERAYKLALNSVYGKTIQTVGKHKPFLCPMWAGLITSHTRSRLLDAALTNPQRLVCFATDGLFSTEPVSVVLGNDLGDWELAASDIRLEIYQSGCYAIFQDGELGDSRFRGISRADIPWGFLRDTFKAKGMSGSVTIPTKRFVGHRTALAHNKPHEQATWVTMDKEVKLTPGVGFPVSDSEWRSELPGVYNYDECSSPYRKLTLSELEVEMMEVEAQP